MQHNEEYDITAAFKKIEDELIDSMVRNMDRHRAEEDDEGIAADPPACSSVVTRRMDGTAQDLQVGWNQRFDEIAQQGTINIKKETGVLRVGGKGHMQTATK